MTENSTEEVDSAAIVGVVDCRCGCDKCEARTSSMYRMIGYCSNCCADPILFLFRSGDEARPGSKPCPICGVHYSMSARRLATADEVPAAAAS